MGGEWQHGMVLVEDEQAGSLWRPEGQEGQGGSNNIIIINSLFRDNSSLLSYFYVCYLVQITYSIITQ